MKSYRFKTSEIKRDILLKVINNELDISDMAYLKLNGHLVGSIHSRPNINMRAINCITDKIQNNKIKGEIINNYEPFASSFVLDNNKLFIKDGNLEIIRNWFAN